MKVLLVLRSNNANLLGKVLPTVFNVSYLLKNYIQRTLVEFLTHLANCIHNYSVSDCFTVSNYIANGKSMIINIFDGFTDLPASIMMFDIYNISMNFEFIEKLFRGHNRPSREILQCSGRAYI